MGTINFIETTKGKSIFTYSNYQATSLQKKKKQSSNLQYFFPPPNFQLLQCLPQIIIEITMSYT